MRGATRILFAQWGVCYEAKPCFAVRRSRLPSVLATFLYAIAFLGNVLVPKTVDRGQLSPPATAVIIDLLLLSAFALQHSIMARHGFKKAWTRLISWHIERSTYVLAASAVLALLLWQWRPIPRVVWAVHNSA